MRVCAHKEFEGDKEFEGHPAPGTRHPAPGTRNLLLPLGASKQADTFAFNVIFAPSVMVAAMLGFRRSVPADCSDNATVLWPEWDEQFLTSYTASIAGRLDHDAELSLSHAIASIPELRWMSACTGADCPSWAVS